MKPLLHFLIALGCIFLMLPLAAQQDTSTLTGWFRWAYGPLDKSEVLSNILIQQTPVFIWPGTFNGIHVHDTLALSRSQWGWLYGQFIAASVDTPYLPSPAIYVQPGMTPHRYGQPVQLMYMATRYDMIREGAIADTLVYIEDHQWYDVENRTESPYIQDTCYALAALHHDVWGLEMTLVLSDSLLFNNLGWTIDSFEIDAGDGLGWRMARPDSLIAITYGAEGRMEVLMRHTHGADTILAQTYLEVKEYDIGGRSGEGMPYDVDNPEKINLGGVGLSLFSSCSDKKIRRPLIVVEGFPNHTEAKQSLFDPAIGLLSKEGLNEWFNDREYDIIWVDWLDNESSVETQANRLINVIEWVNDRKRADGSNEPNVMIGASFGGLVGKYAMLHMHNILGKDSEVETFFTYDSPLKGANIPVGLQAFLRDFASQIDDFGGSVMDLQAALLLLDGPSPAQMLIKRVVPVEIVIPSIPADITITSLLMDDTPFLALQDDIASMEAIRSMDQICRYITLSNGADGGHTQSYLEPAQNIIYLLIILDEVEKVKAPEWCYDIHILVNAFTADDIYFGIYYSREIEVIHHCLGSDKRLYKRLYLQEPLGLDNAPGGWTNLGLTELDDGVNAIEESIDNIDFFLYNRVPSFCFIPTVSSLDMPLSTDRYTSSPEGGEGVLRWTASTELTPLSWDPNLSDYNQSHVSMDSRIASMLKSEIKPPMVAELVTPMQTGEIYNFGSSDPIGDEPEVTPHSINEDITLADGAEIWINRMDKIGYINSSNPENAAPQSFAVHVPGASCENEEVVVVTVGDGGKIIIGDVDGATLNTGRLSFLSRSELNVLAGGEIILTEGWANNLILAGGQMTIEEHGFVDAQWGSRIIIHDGSTLTVKTGGILRISHYSALEVEEGGILVIEPGAIIQLWDGQEPGGEAKIHIKSGTLEWQGSPDFSGNGFFKFDDGSTFLALDDVHITGMGKGFRFMHIGHNLILEGVHVVFEDGQIEYTSNSGFILENGSLEAIDMEFIGPETAYALAFYYPTSVEVTGCSFEGLTGITVHNFQSDISGVQIDDCEFEDCPRGLLVTNSSYITVKNSDFTNCYQGIYLHDVEYFYGYNLDIRNLEPNGNQGVGIELHDTPSCRLHQSTITNYKTGIQIQPNVGENKSNVFLYGSSIVNCEDGILMNDGGIGPDRGLVLMDCSNAIDNDYAVRGKDVLLSIDALSHAAMHSNLGVTPNYFSLVPNEGKFFQVCYDERDEIEEVLARANQWAGTGLNGLPEAQDDYVLKQKGSGNCANSTDFVDLIYLPIYSGSPFYTCPELPRMPEGPGSSGSGQFATSPDTSLHCVRITTSIPADTFLVHNAYIQGMHWFYWEDFDESYEKLEPVAAIHDTIRSGMSGRCRQYIDVARVMVNALAPLRSEPDPLIGGPISDGPTSVDIASRLGKQEVYPNPARGTVTIIPAHGTNRIKIVNAQGLEITEIQGVVGERILSVTDWPEGLYMVISQTDSGRVIEVTRMVVSR